MQIIFEFNWWQKKIYTENNRYKQLQNFFETNNLHKKFIYTKKYTYEFFKKIIADKKQIIYINTNNYK